MLQDEMVSTREISPEASTSDLQRLAKYDVYDKDMEYVGTVTKVWADRTCQAAFVGVQTQWLLGKTHVIPAQGATVNDRDSRIRLAYSKSDIKNGPVLDPKADLDFQNESEIVSYFRKKGPALPELKGVAPSAAYASSSAAAASTAAAGASTMPKESLKEANIPLHEEHLKVGKREVSAGMIRLHKIVRTERVEQGVDLRHEEIIIERVPAKDLKVGTKAFQDEEFYIPLRQEEAVIEKEAHVREEFHARKGAKTEHKTVSEDLRKEDMEVINQDELQSERMRSDRFRSDPGSRR